jgi:transcriptional regulator with XRE-family HTH domain
MKPTNHPLRKWREKQKPRKTLSDLAGELRISPSHLSEIENWNNEPSLDLAARLHSITKIDMKEFAKTPQSEGVQ